MAKQSIGGYLGTIKQNIRNKADTISNKIKPVPTAPLTYGESQAGVAPKQTTQTTTPVATTPKTHRTIEEYPNGSYQITTYDEANNPQNTQLMTQKEYVSYEQNLKNQAANKAFVAGLPATSEEKVAAGEAAGNVIRQANAPEISQIGNTTPEQIAYAAEQAKLGINVAGIAGKVAPSIAGYAASGATGGAVFGTAAAPGLGTLIGAGLGTAAGISYGIINAVGKELTDSKNNAGKLFTTADAAINTAISEAGTNAPSSDPYGTRVKINNQVANIMASERALKEMQANSVEEYLGKPTQDLIAINQWFTINSTPGTRDLALLQQRVAEAFVKPGAITTPRPSYSQDPDTGDVIQND